MADVYFDSDLTYYPIPPEVLFFTVCGVLGVTALSLCSRSVSTSFIFFITLLISRAAMACFARKDVRSVFEKYTWMNAGHYELMYALLPPLVFETAYALEAHDFHKYRVQVMILGGVCYFLNVAALGALTYLQMVIVYFVMGSGRFWDLRTSWLYASVVNAIDPITATTMLHHVGVPHELYVYLKGESMVSDGMAMFTYSVINATDNVTSTGVFAGEVGLYSVGMVVSILIGYVMGRIAAFLLRSLHTDPIRENVVIVVFVYGTFAFCKTFHGSSVLGLFSFALSMNAYRKWINQKEFEANKRMWIAIAFYANCIIVVLTALRSSIYMSPTYLIHGLINLPLVLLSRACALIICTPLLRYTSVGHFPLEYMCLLTWGSVRGATSLLMGWRKLAVYEGSTNALSAQTRAADLLLWLVGTTVATGHLYKGLTIKWLANRLGLAGISRADRDHLETFVAGLNERIKEKIAVRKALSSYAEADWSKIEEIVMVRLDNVVALNVDLTRVDATDVGDLENEWHAREAVKRLCHVELWSMSHFGSLSLSLKHVQQAIDDALDAGTKVRVDRLFARHQPRNVWRRLSLAGGWSPALVMILIGRRLTTTSDVVRLLCCTTAVAQAIVMLVTLTYFSLKTGVAASKTGVFVSSILALFNTAEMTVRMWRRRSRMRLVYVNHGNVLEWLYVITFPCYVITVILLLYISHYCDQDEKRRYFIFGTTCSNSFRLSLIGLSSICWLKLPLAVLLAIRVFSFEVGRVWQRGDEATFEVLQALISISSRIVADLKDGELAAVEPQELRQRLIQEHLTIKQEAEGKLQELYDRRGGTEILVAIKTRRAAFALLYDAVQSFENAKQLGELDDIEYKAAMNEVERLRAKVVRWTFDQQSQSIVTLIKKIFS